VVCPQTATTTQKVSSKITYHTFKANTGRQRNGVKIKIVKFMFFQIIKNREKVNKKIDQSKKRNISQTYTNRFQSKEYQLKEKNIPYKAYDEQLLLSSTQFKLQWKSQNLNPKSEFFNSI
jgi:hypothetical protein